MKNPQSTKTSKLASKREQNRRLGLLADFTQDQNHIGVCLTSNEISSIVENAEKDPAKKEEYLSHISQCSHCYDEWVTLSQICMLPKKRGATQVFDFFTKSKNIAATGSALAIAASIVMFLAIPQEKINEADLLAPVPQKSEEMLLEGTLNDSLDAEQSSVMEMGVTLPDAAIESAPQPQENRQDGAVQNYQKTESKGVSSKEKSIQSAPRLKKTKSKSAPLEPLKTERSAVTEKAMIVAPPFILLKKQIIIFCDDKNEDPSQQQELLEFTNLLLESKNMLSEEEKEIVGKVHANLNTYTKRQSFCSETTPLFSEKIKKESD